MGNVMTRQARLLSGLIVLLLLAACGGSQRAGVFAVKKGMTKEQVQKLAGRTYRSSGPDCWLYHASRHGTAIDGMRFCFTDGKVSGIQTAVHG